VLEILQLRDGDEGESARWLVALRGVDSLLGDLGLTFEGKRDLVERMRESFGREFSADTTPLKHELGAKFRANRATIERSSTHRRTARVRSPLFSKSSASSGARSRAFFRRMPPARAVIVAARRGSAIFREHGDARRNGRRT
jgi:hypothetical protein